MVVVCVERDKQDSSTGVCLFQEHHWDDPCRIQVEWYLRGSQPDSIQNYWQGQSSMFFH